jgi:hypothetical protein
MTEEVGPARETCEPRDTPPATPISEAGIERSVFESLLYGVSLPERLVRSACGVTAGTAREMAGFLVPRSFQDSKTYEIVVRNSLDFLIKDIGGVGDSAPATDANAAGTDFLARKAVGNFMDFAGLSMLHVSPLWVLAAVSDVAYGTKTYVQELARELQAQGLIDDASTIHHVDDVLGAVQKASASAANTFDQPPLSVVELKKSLDETREALLKADPRQLIPESELASYWNSMRSVAESEDVSLLGISGAISMQALSTVTTVSRGTMTGVIVAGQLMNRAVFDHYREGLSRVMEKGVWDSVRESYQPYVEGVFNNFKAEKRTWTEALFDGATYRGAWGKVRSVFRRRSASEGSGKA